MIYWIIHIIFSHVSTYNISTLYSHAVRNESTFHIRKKERV